MRNLEYNIRLKDWIARQSSPRYARYQVRDILGCSPQSVYLWEHQKRKMSSSDFRLLQLHIKDL